MPLDSAAARLVCLLDHRPLAVALGLFVATVVVCGVRLELPDIYGDDEAADAGVVWEMAENGHWLLPFFNGEMVPEKPPLFFWIAAAVARLRGEVDEITVRTPSVLMAAGTVVTVFLAGRHLVGLAPAFVAALMVLSAPMIVARAQTGRVDMTLVACTTGAFFAATFALAPNARRRHRNAFWLLAALAVLAKAGAGLGVVACGTLALLIVYRQSPLGLATPEGIGGFILLAFSWHVFATWQLGHSFVAINLLRENLNLFVGGLSDEPVNRSIRYLVNPTLSMIGGIAPWSIFAMVVPSQWRTAWGAGGKPGLVWAGAGLVFFTAAATRHTYYVAPLLPPLALFLAAGLCAERAVPAPPPVVRVLALSLAGAVIALIAVVVSLRAWAAADWVGMSASDRVNVAILADWWSRQSLPVAVLLVLLAIAVIVLLAVSWRRRAAWVLCVWLVATLTIQSARQKALGTAINARLSLKPFAGEVARLEGPVYFYGPVIPQIVYHARRHIHQASLDELAAQPAFYVIATESELPELRARLGRPANQIATGEGRVNNMDNARVVLLGVTARGP